MELEYSLLDNIEANIRLAATLETRMYEKLGSSESTEGWIKLGQAVRAYDAAQLIADAASADVARANAFGIIRFIVEEGLSESFLVRDIMVAQESQRRQTETLHKCRKAEKQVITFEHFKMLVEIVLRAIRSEISDRALLDRIQNRIALARLPDSDPFE